MSDLYAARKISILSAIAPIAVKRDLGKYTLGRKPGPSLAAKKQKSQLQVVFMRSYALAVVSI